MTETASHPALRAAGQIGLGAFLAFAGTGHLTFQREEFQAQVPSWIPLDADLVVLASGVAEIGLGVALLATWRQPARALVGVAAAAFFVAVFPGNIAQYTGHRDAFGLDTDTKRRRAPRLPAGADGVGAGRHRRPRRAPSAPPPPRLTHAVPRSGGDLPP